MDIFTATGQGSSHSWVNYNAVGNEPQAGSQSEIVSQLLSQNNKTGFCLTLDIDVHVVTGHQSWVWVYAMAIAV